MPDVAIEQPTSLDVLVTNKPALSATSDMPVIETKPDSVAAAMGKEEKPEQTAETAAADEAKTDEQPADIEQPESTSASDEVAKKPPKGVQKRLDELTKQREDERRRADAAEAEKLRILALLEARDKPKQSESAPNAPAKPQRENYNSQEDYDDARISYAGDYAAWKVTQEFEAKQRTEREQVEQARIAEQTETVRKTYADRVEKFKTAHADYSDVAESPDVKISIPMAHAITSSDKGPEIAYYLGSHKDEADRISNLPPAVQLMELGLIVAKISTPQTKQVSAAPAPIKPIKAAAETPAVPDEELSMDAYAAKRKKQWAESRARH